MPKKNPKVEIFKKELEQKIVAIDNQLIDNLNDFELDRTEKHLFLLNLHQLECEKEDTLKKNKIVLNAFKKKHRVFGWSTLRSFTLGFGVRLPYLLLSLIISFLIYKIRTKDKYLKKWFFWLQVSCYSISLFFMLWVFWTSQDFPLKSYPLFFIVFSVLASLATVSFISHKEVFKLKASKRIEKLIVLLMTNNKYIESKINKRKNIEENMEEIKKIIS